MMMMMMMLFLRIRIAFFPISLFIYNILGKLVKMLLYTRVYRYLDWECLKGSYVVQYSKGGIFSKAGLKIHKVPASAK